MILGGVGTTRRVIAYVVSVLMFMSCPAASVAGQQQRGPSGCAVASDKRMMGVGAKAVIVPTRAWEENCSPHREDSAPERCLCTRKDSDD